MNLHSFTVMGRPERSVRAACVILPIMLLLVAGCGSVVPRQTPFMENVGDVGMSARELRVRVVEFGRHFSSRVEQAADEIAAAAEDQEVRRAAIRWKLQAIPAAQEAVLQVDPLMSLVDVWAFAMQMRVYFESGEGSGWFGSLQPVAMAAARRLERDAADLARRVSVSGEISEHEAEIRRWAENHPIEHSLILRDSVIGSGADLLGEQAGAFALVEDMNATTREMANRLAFYNEYLLKQVGWSAETVASDLSSDYHLDSLFDAARSALGATDQLMANLPNLAETERTALLDELAVERAAIIDAINVQRVATLEALRQERIATLESLSRERALVLEAVQAEREVVMNALAGMMEQVPDYSRSIVDHAIWRLAQLLGALLVVAILGMIVVAWMWRPRPGLRARDGGGAI